MTAIDPDQRVVRADTLLIAALRGEPTPWNGDASGADLVLERANQHGVVPLLYRVVSRSRRHAWPQELLTRLAAAAHAATACDLLIERELRRVLDALHGVQIDVLLLKGAYLAYSLYPDPALRPRGDTDLLVADKDRPALDELLKSLGYRPVVAHGGGLVSYQATYRRALAPGVVHDLDVHWRLFNPHTLSDVLPFTAMHADRVPLPRLHAHAFGPGPLHGLLHACLHRAAHHGETDRLLWLWDMALLAQSLDDEQRRCFAALCEESGTVSLVRGAVAAAQRTFPATALQQTLTELPDHDTAGRRRVVPSADARHLDVARADLGALPGWRQRVRYIWQHAVPRPEYMLRRYNSRTRAALPLLYVRRWGSGVRKLFRQRYSGRAGNLNNIG